MIYLIGLLSIYKLMQQDFKMELMDCFTIVMAASYTLLGIADRFGTGARHPVHLAHRVRPSVLITPSEAIPAPVTETPDMAKEEAAPPETEMKQSRRKSNFLDSQCYS